MQLSFRLKIVDVNNISLVCYDGDKESVVLSSSGYNVINFNKINQNNKILQSYDGHSINQKWFKNQFLFAVIVSLS